MTKTTAPRVRAEKLYAVELDGKPVAQAMAISQAEAVRLYVESVQQPTMTARLSSPLEARTLAGLPLLSRGEPVRDAATPDLFGDVPAAPVSPVAGAVVDPVLLATYCLPVDLPVKTYPPAVLAQIVAELAPDHVEDVREMVPPQHAPIEAVTEGLASGAEDQPGESVAGDCAEPASPPADASPASADAPTMWLDDVALTARKSDAYHAGFRLGRRGLKRFSAEMLMADADMIRGLPEKAADDVHCELMRGFEDGRVQAEPADTQERRRLPDEAPKGAGKVVAKYRNPADGSTWTGRGLKPRWLVEAIEAGRTQDEFLIDQA